MIVRVQSKSKWTPPPCNCSLPCCPSTLPSLSWVPMVRQWTPHALYSNNTTIVWKHLGQKKVLWKAHLYINMSPTHLKCDTWYIMPHGPITPNLGAISLHVSKGIPFLSLFDVIICLLLRYLYTRFFLIAFVSLY